MKTQLFILVIFILTTACTSQQLKSNKATILPSHTSTKNTEELFHLVGLDGRYFEGTEVKAGAHLFYIRGLQTTEEEKKQVNESMHGLKVRLEENLIYRIMSDSNDQFIKVWLQEDKNGQIVSNVSTILVKDIKVIELDEVVPDKTERIQIFGTRPHLNYKFKLEDACKFKTDHRNLKRGFDGSISDRRLPSRVYTGYNC